ncbi:MAG TPA: AAA family ATPase [Candidatus Angelobacter sp.]
MPAAAGRIGANVDIEPFTGGGDHLLAELQRLSIMLNAEVLRMRAANLLTENQFRGLYVSDEQIDAILHASSANDAGPPDIDVLDMHLAECEQVIAARCEASSAACVMLPLERLTQLYSLSSLERDALLLTLAPELDPRFETLYSYAQNDVTRKRATVGLILRLLEPRIARRLRLRTLFSAAGRLLQTPLVRFSDEPQEREASLLSRAVRPEERIVDFLLGHEGLDNRLRPFTTCLEPARSLAALHLPQDLLEGLRHAASALREEGGVLFFHGPAGGGKRAAAEALSAENGRGLVVADLRQAHAAGAGNPAMLTLLRREAQLRGANLLLAHAEAWLAEDGQHRQQQPLSELLYDSIAGSGLVLFVTSESFLSIAGSALPCAWTAFEFPLPGFVDRTRLWQDAITATGAVAQSSLATVLANQFLLTGGQIHKAARMARINALLRDRGPSELTRADFEAAARAQSNHGLRKRAQKVDSAHKWSDLVLPPRTMQQLHEICAAGRHRSIIYTEWGFDARLMQGKGLNVLFCGPSGTGKTMSASIAARELGLDLYKIDLSSVISKYIGETEKQLSEIFREAQSSNAILFFDEADAIFGKRSEVKDAHDRYANIEVAYLLQKMEEYEGIVILATNFRKNIDDAFTRRIHYIVEFPFPEERYRERIWRSLMPASAPLAEDVDFGFLGRQFELAGGNIRNVVLAAASLAVESGGAMRMEHFVLATARELQKMGKLPTRSDFREYYDLTRERV